MSPPICVRAYPNPFNDFDVLEAEVDRGLTLAEITGRADLPAIIIADGRVIDCEEWSTYVPAGDVLIRRIPAGGDTGRLIGSIAILALAVWAGPIVAGAAFGQAFGLGAVSMGFMTAAGAVATAAIGIAGTLLLNALIPPPDIAGPGGQAQQLYSLTGTNNQVAAFAPVPNLYGRMRFYPPIPMTALPYSELVGDDQYLRCLFTLGYGPLQINGISTAGGLMTSADSPSAAAAIKIADTSIDQFEDCEWEIGTPSQITLYRVSITEQVVGVNMPKTGAASEGAWVADGGSETRTTEPDTEEVSLDLYAPALYSVNENTGSTRGVIVRWKVEARKTSSSPIGAWTTLVATWEINNRDRDPVRLGRRFTLASAGTWEIKLTRVSTYLGKNDSYSADMTWTVLRSIKRGTNPVGALTDTLFLALRIRASDQVGGRLDRLSVEATRIVPVWTTTVSPNAWVDTATRNPAWAFADVLTGAATRNPIAKSRLDVTALKSWADWCDTEALRCDMIIDAQGTVFDRARDIASTGLGSWHVIDDGKISIVRDQVQTAVMQISPRNSSGFSSEFVYHQLPHALRVQFIDSTTWEPTERLVYDDGYNPASSPHTTPTRFEQLQLVGVTDADQAWKLGRYHLAQLRLRPEVFSWEQDIGHLVFERGDTVEIATDVILVGLRWARIKAVNSATEIEVGELLPMTTAASPAYTYGVRIQRDDGTIIQRDIVTVNGGATTITLTTSATGLNVGDHLIFGISGSEIIEAKISRIEPRGNFQARVVAVSAAENIFDAWTGTIPTYDPVITAPIDQAKTAPPVPTFIELRSESMLDGDGNPNVRLVAVFTVDPGLYGIQVEARYRTAPEEESTLDFGGAIAEYAVSDVTEASGTTVGESGSWRYGGIVPAAAGKIIISGVEAFVEYQVQLRAVRARLVSAWTSSLSQTAVISAPSAIGALNAVGITEGIRVTWEFPTNPTSLDYASLYMGSTSDFSAAALVYQGRNTSFDIDLDPGTTRHFWAIATFWGLDSAPSGPVSAAAGSLDWNNIGGDGVEEGILNSGVVYSSGESAVAFSYDGTDYQTQRTEPIRYTYDVDGTYLYQHGSAAADANREFPWLDVPMYFYRSAALIKTLTFRHLCDYGLEDSNARVGTKCRSVWISSSGTELDADFSVQIGASTGRSKWAGTQVTTGSPQTTYDLYTANEYGGSLSDYMITVTHVPSGAIAKQLVTLAAIAAVAPYYDYGGVGGGYK